MTAQTRKVRAIHAAAILVHGAFCLYLGLEGIETAFASGTASIGVSVRPEDIPNPIILAALDFAAFLPFILMSARAERWWSSYLFLAISVVGLFWAGAIFQFGVPARSVLIPLATGLAGFGLFIAHGKLKPVDRS